MKLKTYLIALLVFLSLAPIHGKEESSKAGERYRYAIAEVAEAEGKIRCVRVTIALDTWQSRLRLDNWHITLSCLPFPINPLAFGVTEWHPERREAKVWINTEGDNQPHELVVIHELLHLVIAETRMANSRLGDEQSAILLSEIIYHGKRGDKCLDSQ